VRAVVLSDLTAVHVKHFVGELSAFCGAVTAGAGAGAGICYLRGGSLAQYEATIVNTIANVGGIVCDGAKPSCAAKISAAVDAAISAVTWPSRKARSLQAMASWEPMPRRPSAPWDTSVAWACTPPTWRS